MNQSDEKPDPIELAHAGKRRPMEGRCNEPGRERLEIRAQGPDEEF